ncbi:mannose-6-phosphate isomerase, class I [Actinomycetospora sp. TBRC 11914]|uniref:mannose-6-phosphate isomerase, class I n=1 Tax=Actinomycetospora sp. TBRC 11914 TaxID=2729387 RepID=UPI00145CBD93|nr:mannose-6-phosphate isomerase, class I [Actinomycetospora sp. TBRC 11914]NMO90771.1 mannose-6-phosphate isomerase, class I [Actinomycetospora sp. TBRC 11914]
MELLEGTVRPYAWGSRTHIAALLGEPVPSPHPQAELWLGAHADAPSRLVEHAADRTLLDALAADPEGTFGPARAGRWQGRLPFLLKVLAADEPLSLQTHPSAEQAAAGFAREEASGVPQDAPDRNYRDPLPKPEILCALEEFHALAGFRDAVVTVRLLRALEVDQLAHHTELLAAQPGPDGLRALFTTWITLPQRIVDELVPALLDGCVRLAKTPGSPGAPGGEFEREVRTLLDLGERYPGDAGVLAALLLNRVVLAEGECLFQPAGSPHAYLSGCGIELMANSDNVLRAGLTPKHVDVPELLRILDFRCGPPPVIAPRREGPRSVFTAPSDHFRLVRLDVGPDDGPVELGIDGPRIVVVVRGDAELRDASGRSKALAQGRAVWVPAADGVVTVEATPGHALVFAAGDGWTGGHDADDADG